jgi:hypothetical protein
MALFHRGTRYLSHLYLTVDAERPLLLSSTLRDEMHRSPATSQIPICSTQWEC